MNSFRKHCLLATGAAVGLWASPALAQDGTITYVDLTGSVGYSSNPVLRTIDSESSFFGRASARGVHAWRSERTSATITGFLEGTTYFNDYGLESIFSVNGNASHQASETVTVFGSAGVSGDLSGQLSNRFLYVPPIPEIPDPTIPPPPPTVENPDLFDFSGRTYHIYGQAGTSIRTSAEGRVSLSGGASRAIYDTPLLDEYTTVFAHGSYHHTLSERTSVGGGVRVSRTAYDNSDDHSTIISPTVSVTTQLSEEWSASGSVGMDFSSVDRGATDDSSSNLSFGGSVCRTTESERLCANVDRYSAASASTTLVTTTSAGVHWYKKLDEVQTLQLSASVSHYAEEVLDLDRTSNHYSLAASYSRVINERLSGGVDLGARRFDRDGIDPDTDISGTVFVRYRLGDLG